MGEPEPPHTPNHIALSTRIFYAVASLGLILYGAWGLWSGDLFLPGKRGPGLHLRGIPAWLMAGAMLAGAANMTSVVADHFDTRNNETNYRLFGKFSLWTAAILFALSLLLFVAGNLA